MNDYLYQVATRLVAFDTVSAKSDLDAMEYIASELRPRGFKTALQTVELLGVSQANLVAWVGPPRADGLIISGHVDTVPYDGQPGWEREPLKLELEAFLDSVRTGAPPLVSGKEGAAALDLACAIMTGIARHGRRESGGAAGSHHHG